MHKASKATFVQLFKKSKKGSVNTKKSNNI